MVIEHAGQRIVRKPWGNTDLRPWSEHRPDGGVGEIWFERSDRQAPDSALLLKLLFTNEPLSIQVHPSDAFAHSIGLANGKSEAWYILSATPDARVAVGLKRQLAPAQLRAAIENGSIAELVAWCEVAKGDVISVPAGTIHAIGAGLVIAEIQQRSEATFRLFDHGRERELHVDHGVAAARAGPADRQAVRQRLTDARTLLIASPHFVLERIELSPASHWELRAEQETWLLVVEGEARIGQMNATIGEAFYVEADRADIEVGASGLKGLLAYIGPDANSSLLRRLDQPEAKPALRRVSSPPLHHRAIGRAPFSTREARQ